MRRIKILHILEATIGGTRTHLRLLVKHLNKKKFIVSVACSTLREKSFYDDIDNMKKQGITVYKVSMVRQIHPLKDIFAFLKIYNIILNGKYDIVHAHSSKAGFLGRIAAWLIGVPVILYTPHAFAFQGYIKKFSRLFYLNIEKIMARFTTRIICVSESEQIIASQQRIAKPSKMVIIENAIELPPITITRGEICRMKTALDIGANQFVVGTAGYFRPQKDYPCFLKAAARVKQVYPDVIFLVLGDGEGRPQIEQMMKSLMLEDHVILMGSMPDIHRYYAIMDLFVLTSRWEGMPYSILEAMSCGKPVIATNVPGSRDIIEDGITGRLVPPGADQAIAAAILSLIMNAEQRKLLSQNAAQLVQSKYGIRDKIVDLERLYEWCHTHF